MSAYSLILSENQSLDFYSSLVQTYGQNILLHAFTHLGVEHQPQALQVQVLFERALANTPESQGKPLELIVVKDYLDDLLDGNPLLREKDLLSFWRGVQRSAPFKVSAAMRGVKNDIAEIRKFFIENQPLLETIKKLNLSNLDLTHLPGEIALFTQLEQLNLDGNRLKKFGKKVILPKHLTRVTLNNNIFTHIPQQIFTLHALKTLEVKINLLKELPDEIGQLIHLIDLMVDDNEITHISELIGKLTNLRTFSANVNKIPFLPESLGDLENLESLYLYHNELAHLPESFYALRSLKIAVVAGNQITHLPPGIELLTELETLVFSDNRVEEIGDVLASMKKLKLLLFNGNPLHAFISSQLNMDQITHCSFDYFEGMKIDEPMRKFVIPRMIDVLSEEDVEKLKGVYWALGKEKWKEFIDGEFHELGEDVFDLGLHGGCKEPGFKGSMDAACHFLGSQWKRPLSAQFYLDIHKIACAHFEGKRNDTEMTKEEAGTFRSRRNFVSASFPLIGREVEKEFNHFDTRLKKLFGPLFGLGSIEKRRTMLYYPMESDQIRLIFNLLLTDFHHEMNQASTPLESIAPIAKLIRHLEWLHATRDGCGRTDTALLNFLLTSCGLHPVLLADPYRSSFRPLSHWIQILEDEGLPAWRETNML